MSNFCFGAPEMGWMQFAGQQGTQSRNELFLFRVPSITAIIAVVGRKQRNQLGMDLVGEQRIRQLTKELLEQRRHLREKCREMVRGSRVFFFFGGGGPYFFLSYFFSRISKKKKKFQHPWSAKNVPRVKSPFQTIFKRFLKINGNFFC